MLSHWTKISIKGKNKPIYLENAKYAQDQKFICGYEVDRMGEPKLNRKGGDTLHIIQLGEGVKVTNMEMDKMYGHLKPHKVGTYPDVQVTLTDSNKEAQ